MIYCRQGDEEEGTGRLIQVCVKERIRIPRYSKSSKSKVIRGVRYKVHLRVPHLGKKMVASGADLILAFGVR